MSFRFCPPAGCIGSLPAFARPLPQRAARLRSLALLTLLGCLPTTAAWGQSQRRVPLSPQESQQQIVLEAGYEARVLAHEPQAIDPVEVTFDDAGRMWVVEMHDYPFRTADRPGGRIQVLSDNDGDGHYESAQVFADELEMPTGIALWKDGAVVTLAGKLVYLRDTDRDGRADQTQVWLEGFKEDNEQLRANHPRLGPDGKWYIACGLRGGDVRLGQDLADEQQAAALTVGSRDVRFDPRSKSIDLVTGPAQFGLCFDTFGSRFFCSNRNPAVQVLFEQSDLTGNPLAGLAPSVADVLAAGEQSQVHPLVEAWTTSHLHSGQFTAACGVFVRPDPSTSNSRSGNQILSEVFACEPTGSLVKRQRVQPSETTKLTLTADELEPQRAGREWLASRDAWFRPVNVGLTPDGQTVIVDMHRAVIEHPQWVPDELKNRPDERWGDAAGRVYWVGRENRLPAVLDSLRTAPLGQRNDQQLVALVADENPWMRQTATRLLLEREAADTAQALMQQAHDGQLGTAGRIASLRLAANLLHQLPPQTAELFTSDNKALALVALRVAQNFPASLPQHATAIAALASSDSGPLQFEALLCLGILSAHDKAVASQVDIEPLAEQLASSDEPLLLMAAGSAFRHQPEVLLHTWLSALTTSQAALPPSNFLGDVARSLVAAALRAETDLQQTMALAQRAATAGDSPRGQLAALAAVQQFVQSRPQDAMFDEAFWSSMADLLSAPDITSDAQVVAINILGRSPREEDAQRLGELVQENSNPSLAEPLLQAWAGTNSVDSDRYLVDSLATAAPHMQRAMLSLVGARPQRLELLVEQLEAGKLTARQIGAAELKKLVARAQGATQKTLQHHLSQITNSNRAQVIESYKPSLALKADVTRGVEVFRKHCASCHRIGEIGVQVGPDISDSRTKQPLELLGSILDPNLAIDNNYFRFVVLTEDDRVIEGIIAEETADAIVLRGQDDKRELIRREDIVELKATGVSLMPEGIEAQIDHQAMADLIGFIKGWRYVDGAIPKL